MIRSETHPDRQSWLAARRVGGSDAGMLWSCGYSSQSIYAAWADRALGIPIQFAPADQKRLDLGVAMEPVIRRMFVAETGIEVQDDPPHTLWINDDYPFMTASLDTKTMKGNELVSVEIKNVGRFMTHEWEDGGLPLMYQCQSCHQSIVMGASGGYVVGLLAGDELAVRWVEVDEQFAAMHVERCRDFWRHVETKTPPEIDGSLATTDAIKNRWRREKGPRVEVGDWLDKTTRQLERLESRAKWIDERINARKNAIKDAIGEAEGCISPSGVEFTWITQERKEYTVAASSSRVLRRSKRKGK